MYQGVLGTGLNGSRDSTDVLSNSILSAKELKELGIDIEPLKEVSKTSIGIKHTSAVIDSARFVSLSKDPDAQQAYLDSIMAVVTSNEPEYADSSHKPAIRLSSASSYSVGAIPLEYGVSGTGARTYSVPIYTAPDIEYAPSLALVYNSQGGYGYGGYGWDLAGLSSITLCD